MVSGLAEFQMESTLKHCGSFPQDHAFIFITMVFVWYILIVEEAFPEITD